MIECWPWATDCKLQAMRALACVNASTMWHHRPVLAMAAISKDSKHDEQHGLGDARSQRLCECEYQINEHSSDNLLDYTEPLSVLDPRRCAASHRLSRGGMWCASGGVQFAGVSGQDWPSDSAIDRLGV